MIKKSYYILFALLLTSIQLFAVKATPEPIHITQPDGTELTIRLRGDEFFKYTTTEDGYLIRQDETGVYKYATLIKDKFELSTQKVSNISKRTNIEKQYISQLERNPDLSAALAANKLQKIGKISASTAVSNQFPLTGNPRSLVILVNFSDKSFVTATPKTAFTNLLNQTGYTTNGGTGSARDYFIESSFGQFSPQFDVVGPYTLTKNMDFYGKNDSNDDDQNPRQLIIDACAAADADGLDFTIYDTDNNGIVDNVFVYYAGNNEAEGAAANTIWPHRWSLASNNTKFDGKIISDYACTSELRGSSGSTMCGIGTFCHEFGHVLGLADYYHTADSDKKTLETWNIMDGGAYNNNGRTPPTYSAYDRFFLDWLKPTELKSPQNVTLEAVRTSNKAFLISQNGNHNLNGANPISNEFFILENRQKTGFDAYLPFSGLLIWHIDYNANAWANNAPNNYTGKSQTGDSHMRVYLQPISGSSTTPGSAFKTGSFYPTLWNGVALNKPITAINETNGIVTFKFMGGSTIIQAPLATAATDIKTSSFVANWNAVDKAKVYYLTAYSITDGESTDTENFDKGMEPSLGWNINANGTTTSLNYSGKAIPALIFKNNNDSIETEIYPATVKRISFYMKSINSTNSSVVLSGWNSDGWVEIDRITSNSNLTNPIQTYDFPASANYKRFKFKYEQSSGATAIDDIGVTFAENVHYICKNKATENLTDTLYNLVSGRLHYYKVTASDVAYYSDNTKVYEILSAPSNIISLETLPYSDAKKVRVERDKQTNDMLVFLESLNDNILIYNTSGQLIANIKPADLRVNITNYLQAHNLYIISVGMRFNKIIF